MAGLIFVDATITDADAVPVPRAADRLHFRVTGPAEIIAVDNGDATDRERFQNPDRQAFNGKCLVILRAKPGAAGAIVLSAQADGLQPADRTLQVP